MEQQIEALQAELARIQNQFQAHQDASNVQSHLGTQALINTVPSPETFSFNKDEWISWSKHYERYRVATALDRSDEKTQINNLLLFMGPKVSKLLETHQKQETDFSSYKQLKEFFDKYFSGTRNVIYARAIFNRRTQKELESAEEFISDLMCLAKACEYKTLEDELIRDRLVVGIRDAKLSEALQMDDTLTLQKAIEKISQSERIKEENKHLRAKTENVSQVYRKNRSQEKTYQWRETEKKGEVKKKSQCWKCGKTPSHAKNKCPANRVRCRRCRIVGHYAVCCRTKSVSEVVEETSSEEYLTKDGTSTESSDLGEIINICRIRENKYWKVKLKIGNENIKFKIDTGADETVISNQTYTQKLKNLYKLKKSTVKLMGPGVGKNSELKVLGQIEIPVLTQDKVVKIKTYVVDTKENLLGRPALIKLGLVTWKNNNLTVYVNEVSDTSGIRSTNEIPSKELFNDVKKNVLETYSQLFVGLGRLKNFKHKICISENITPYACATPRRVPLPLQQKVEDELKKMVKDGVIENVEDATEWCAPMVVVPKKDGRVRVCSDFTELNKFVIRERYQLPSVEETLAKLEEASIFTKLDFNSGFWQLMLDKQSRKYTTFITPFGRFAYKRVPFGITSAPEVFQKVVSELIGSLKLDGVLVHADDILVTGKTIAEHDKNLHKVLKLLVKSGLTINYNKCEFKKTETRYLGYIVCSDGIKIDPKSTEAIVRYPVPTNRTDIRKFLGLVNYVSKFVKDLATKTQSLRELLRNDTAFIWTKKHNQDFEQLKAKIVAYPVLARFSTQRKTRVSADSSNFGLGAVLEQLHDDGSWRPVYYCSKTLSDSEKRYAQIEKEALAVTWACERLEQFLLGSEFEILTDHKPLVVILASKEINKLSSRLQRFRMRLLKFQYKITYVPGKTFFVPDALSRAPLSDGSDDMDIIYDDSEVYINAIYSDITKQTLSTDTIIKEQTLDDGITQVKKYIMFGWPVKSKVNPSCHPYYKYRQTLSMYNELLCYGDRLVIPKSLRKICLSRIHDGHFGLNRCMARAKGTVWWPGINHHITDLIMNCETCIKHKPSKVEPMIGTDVPNRPWSMLGADLADNQGKTYLVVQDYYSKFPEIKRLKRITSAAVIKSLKDIFSRHGVPDVLRTDNGKQFACSEFKQFSEDYGFVWTSSSPHYQQSNGQAESAVKLLKKMLNKNPDDISLALLTYRNTVMTCGASPAQLLFGRSLKDRVPVIEQKLEPRVPDHHNIKEKMKVEKEKQEKNYNRRHRVIEKPEPKKGDRVWIINMQKEGKVIEHAAQPRSHIIQTEDDNLIRRNNKHIHILPEEDSTTNRRTSVSSGSDGRDLTTEKVRPNRNRRAPSYLKDFVCD